MLSSDSSSSTSKSNRITLGIRSEGGGVARKHRGTFQLSYLFRAVKLRPCSFVQCLQLVVLQLEMLFFFKDGQPVFGGLHFIVSRLFQFILKPDELFVQIIHRFFLITYVGHLIYCVDTRPHESFLLLRWLRTKIPTLSKNFDTLEARHLEMFAPAAHRSRGLCSCHDMRALSFVLFEPRLFRGLQTLATVDSVMILSGELHYLLILFY